MTKALVLSALLVASVPSAGYAARGTPMIYDDDGPVMDVGAVTNYGVFYKMIDHGWIDPLATIADSSNALSAPGIYALAQYYQHTAIPIGANQEDTPRSALCTKLGCNFSTWNKAWVAQFDPRTDDDRRKYPDCAALYRRTLATQPNHSVVIVETGFAACLMQVLQAPPDAISALSGGQLMKRKVKRLVIMGGDYPKGAEWNFQSDAVDYAGLFKTWTRQNGYPPLYLVGWSIGNITCSGAPTTASSGATASNDNPIAVAVDQAKQADGDCVTGAQRPVWDQLAIMYGAWGARHGGTTYFTLSAGGTNTVNPVDGTNVWSNARNSGHYYLIARADPARFANLLDGYTHRGLLLEAPIHAATVRK